MRVSFYATLRKIVGTKQVEFELPDEVCLHEILDVVVRTYPDLSHELLDDAGELSRHIHLFVNGRGSKWLTDGMDTVVDGSQTIEFFPAVAGG